MKSIVFKNRFTLLLAVLISYVVVLTLDNVITGREPALLEFENSLFELNIEELRNMESSFFDYTFSASVDY